MNKLTRRIVVLAMGASIAGCFGGNDNGCPPFSDFCGSIGPIPFPIFVGITKRQTVQVGTTATFTASNVDPTQVSFKWCRAPAKNAACVTIPGEVGPTLTIANVSLADDGAFFGVTVTSATNSGGAMSQLFVSSMPPTSFQDGDFADADWSVIPFVSVPGALTYTAAQVATGGNPGSYRKITYAVTQDSRSWLFHAKSGAVYDPRSMGAIRSVDISFDCRYDGFSKANVSLEQDGRRYAAYNVDGQLATGLCGGAANSGFAWTSEEPPSFARTDFVLVDGPPCGAGQSCPDFSATAAPLQLGFASEVETGAPTPANPVAHFEYSIDNWKITIWRQ